MSKVLAFAAIVVSIGFVAYGVAARNQDGSGVGDPAHVNYLRLSEDRRTVQLEFRGGSEFDAGDPCSMDYAVSGRVREEILEVEILVTKGEGHDRLEILGDVDCSSFLYDRTIDLKLEEPFTGSEVRDVTSGYRVLLEAPDGLARLTGLPEGWVLRLESGAPLVHSGGWIRVYSPSDDRSTEVVLVQAFGGDARVRTIFTHPRDIEIGEIQGELTIRRSGEQVLLWSQGTDGFALFAYPYVFSLEELVELAQSLET